MILVENMGKENIEIDWGYKYKIKAGQKVTMPANVANAIKKRCPTIKILGDEEELKKAEEKIRANNESKHDFKKNDPRK